MTHRTRGLAIAVALALAVGLLAGARLLGAARPDSSLAAEAILVPRQFVSPAVDDRSPWAARSAARLHASRLQHRPTPGELQGLNWAALAECESGGNPHEVSPAGYFGLYQLTLSAWQSAGGHGSPAQADPHEQTLRAQRLYARHGAELWPVCARYL